MYIFMNTNTQRHTFWFVLHGIPVVHSGCYEHHFYSYFVWNVFVASDVCIPFIIVSFGVFFPLFIHVIYVWICFVLILHCWLPAASVSSAISFTGQKIKQ